MLSRDLEKSLNHVFKLARRKRHASLTVEHLLLGLLDNRSALEVLIACHANMDALREMLMHYLEDNVDEDQEDRGTFEVSPTLGFQRVLQRAVFHVQSAGKPEVLGSNVLVAIFSEQESQAVFFLREQGVTRLDVVNFIAHGLSKDAGDGLGKDGKVDPNGKESEEEDDDDEGEGESDRYVELTPLERYTENLNDKAGAGLIDPLIGREDEINRMIQVLCRRRKNNPLLVGESGVGKTAIVEGLAKRIFECKIPGVLMDAQIYSLDVGGLVAGTKYRGDFEKRLHGILRELKANKDAILFIDEIHNVIGAGSASGTASDAAEMLKPMLASGEIRCIGSTTHQEYRSTFERDAPMARRFQKIDVPEPSLEQAFKILQGLRPQFEKHHGVQYSDEVLRAAIDLSSRFIPDRFLPDKAVDVIDEVGSAYHLRLFGSKTVQVQDIEAAVAKIARIPPTRVTISDKEALQNLERNMKLLVYGQDKAITALVSTIKLARAGLRDPHKPWGSFLFTGPTGVGKTEVALQMSKLLGIELLRFDMSEYMESHSVSRLIGAPPGYVGYREGGLLTEAISKQPYAVLLLDEMEKAHSDIFNLLLQVMDNGTLTDSNGRKANFRHVILIMTSNAGAFEMGRNSIGFMEQDNKSDGMEAIKTAFTPEFRNRLDGIIQFNSLAESDVKNVVDKFLTQLQGQLDEKDVIMEVDQLARDWLAFKGYDRRMGARPMARVIQEHLKKPLAEALLFGELAHGGKVYVTADPKEGLKIRVEPTEIPQVSLESPDEGEYIKPGLSIESKPIVIYSGDKPISGPIYVYDELIERGPDGEPLDLDDHEVSEEDPEEGKKKSKEKPKLKIVRFPSEEKKKSKR